jgi:hypothetical protein
MSERSGVRDTPWLWILAAFCAALAVSIATLLVFGAGGRGTSDALRITGRLSFLLFLPAYGGGAIATLSGGRIQVLRRHARDFGLAFASAHVVHLSLVAWLCYVGDAPPLESFVVFGVAAVWLYLLALLSLGNPRQMVGERFWRIFNMLGMNYIALTFALDFGRFPPRLDANYLVGYLPFLLAAVVTFLLRLAAWAWRLRDNARRSLAAAR